MTLGILDRTLNRIAQDPGNWWQTTWCKCFAGHLLREAGYSDEQVGNLGLKYKPSEDGFDRNLIPAHAQNIAQLSDHQAAVLFHGDNTYEMLEWIVSDIKGDTMQEWDYYADKADI